MVSLEILCLLFFFFVSPVFSLCRPLDDAAFDGIFGRIYIREQFCTDVAFTELRNHIATKVNRDGLYTIENSNIGSIKNELIADNKANMIITFSCINCQIREIEKEGIKKMVKLYNLTLVGNNFEYFDGTCIKNNNNRFQHLNLTNNNISKVENLCPGLKTTKTIVLRDNPIENIDESIFHDCDNLIHLDISNTSIKLAKDMLKNNLKLYELHLSNMKLSNLESVYLDASTLVHLDIANNEFTTLDTKLFEYYRNLDILDLNDNKISKIIYQDKLKSVSLRQLFLRNNNLTKISIINLEYFKEIQTLDLSFNKLQEIPVHFFEHSNDLRHLLLSNNQLKKLSVGIFSPVSDLVHLDISYNNFSEFDENMLHSLNLQEFDISGNNLTSFEPYMLGSMVSNLKRLGISDLKWKCESLNYVVRFCKSHNINCLPKQGPNYKTTNVQGISCVDNKTEHKSFITSQGLTDEYLNLTKNQLEEQNRLYQRHLDKIGSLNSILVFITICIMIFVIFKAIVPTVIHFYDRYKTNQELLNRNHLNVSHMELVQDSDYGHV